MALMSIYILSILLTVFQTFYHSKDNSFEIFYENNKKDVFITKEKY